MTHAMTTIPRLLFSKFPLLLALAVPLSAAPPEVPPLWARDNLFVWCIVPFDAKKRTPEQRAEMVKKLGIKKIAYDWRAEHVPQFEAEILAYQKHGLEFFTFWGIHDSALELFPKYGLHPQIWNTVPSPAADTEEERVKKAALQLLPAVEKAKKIGSQFGLYNHGGWGGEPANMVAVCEYLRKNHGADHVGIVYNFHHGHGHIAKFKELWAMMQPYLLAVNLNGMEPGGDKKGRKILHLAEGDQELEMMRIIQQSGWQGPVGIIDHRPETDSEVTLRNNLRGFDWLVAELQKPGAGGARPDFSPKEEARNQQAALAPGRHGQALNASQGGLLLPGLKEGRGTPITVEAWVKLNSAQKFNVIVASDPKTSGEHWELYSYAGTGDFSVYLPGQGGEVRSGVNIIDGEWHHVAMVLEKERVRLWTDGKLVKESSLPPRTSPAMPGLLAVGRTVEGTSGCDGLVDEVRIFRGAPEMAVIPTEPLKREENTLGLWSFDELPSPVAGGDVGSVPASLDRKPLNPEARPLHTHPVNRERLYDFYARQALDFAKQSAQPALLPPFPGLDGGQHGVWGNQTDASWRSNRWNEMDIGSVQAGVFRHDGRTVARAVCVNFGQAAACFDPDSLLWTHAWQGDFLTFGTHRFGFVGGIAPKGKILPDSIPNTEAVKGAVYQGYYRHGEKVVFSYQLKGQPWLEAAAFQDGRLVVIRERKGAGKLTELTRGGPAQWPQTFVTQGTLGDGKPYAIDTLPPPAETPWRSLWHFGDHDFFPNGDAALCTFEGEVWLVTGIDATLSRLTWKRFATGLHQPLGLRIVDGNICVLGRDQITRLHDLNGDGEADFYESYCRGYDTPTGGHDYVTGLQRDAQGRFYFVSGKQGLVRTSPDLKSFEMLGTGFRNPNGVGLGPQGEVAVAVQEGDWTPASMVYEILPKPGEKPGHYGFGGPKPGPRGHLPPLAYLPRGVDHSCGGQAYVESTRWGAPAGTLVHFSWGNGNAFLIFREQSGDIAQGAVIPLPGDFRSGAHRGRFHPKDGQLYVTGMTGWITYTPDEGCFQRMRYIGGEIRMPVATRARDNGVLLRFTEPLDRAAAGDARRYFAQQWNYRYGKAYGSNEYSVRYPDRAGHDVLAVTSVHVLGDGRTLFLEIPQLHPSHVLHLYADLPGLLSRECFLTLHRLDDAFTGFPGYQKIAKTPLPAPDAPPSSSTDIPVTKPVAWEQGKPGRALTIAAASGLQFAQKELHAKAGERLSLTFDNPDELPHNWVLIKPGAADRVGDLANKLLSAPDALARHYVPEAPDILCHTRILDPKQKTTIHFTAPASPGRYPYLCTFPGHSVIMRGELIVE